jgi:cytochrome P450
VTVIAELLGVAPEDRDRFKTWSAALTKSVDTVATTEELDAAVRALEDCDVYFREVVEERRRSPRADLLSTLLRVQESGDRLSMDELLAPARLILAVGHETTVNLICNGTLALRRHPGARAAVAADPLRMRDAVEELLRFDSPVQITARFTQEDTRGEVVVAILGAANRDPAQFPDPDRVDLRRDNAHTHLVTF